MYVATKAWEVHKGAAASGYMDQHHARLLFGTDTRSSPTYANPPGLNGCLEMRHLVDAGVTPDICPRLPPAADPPRAVNG
jgi:hypothetical protein